MKREEDLLDIIENQVSSIFEMELEGNAQRIGGLIGNGLTFILVVIEVLINKEVNSGYFFILMSYAAGFWIYKAAVMRRRREKAMALMMCIFAIYGLINYIASFHG